MGDTKIDYDEKFGIAVFKRKSVQNWERRFGMSLLKIWSCPT